MSLKAWVAKKLRYGMEEWTYLGAGMASTYTKQSLHFGPTRISFRGFEIKLSLDHFRAAGLKFGQKHWDHINPYSMQHQSSSIA